MTITTLIVPDIMAHSRSMKNFIKGGNKEVRNIQNFQL